MAIITPSPLINTICGSVGNLTFRTSPTGIIATKKPVSRTTRQSATQHQNARVAAANDLWRTASSFDRSQWTQWSAYLQGALPSQQQSLVRLPQLFLRCVLQSHNDPPTRIPPPDIRPLPPTVLLTFQDTPAGFALKAWLAPTGYTHLANLSVSYPQQPHRTTPSPRIYQRYNLARATTALPYIILPQAHIPSGDWWSEITWRAWPDEAPYAIDYKSRVYRT